MNTESQFLLQLSVEQTNALRQVFKSTQQTKGWNKDGSIIIVINESEAQEIFELSGQIGKMLVNHLSKKLDYPAPSPSLAG